MLNDVRRWLRLEIVFRATSTKHMSAFDNGDRATSSTSSSTQHCRMWEPHRIAAKHISMELCNFSELEQTTNMINKCKINRYLRPTIRELWQLVSVRDTHKLSSHWSWIEIDFYQFEDRQRLAICWNFANYCLGRLVSGIFAWLLDGTMVASNRFRNHPVIIVQRVSHSDRPRWIARVANAIGLALWQLAAGESTKAISSDTFGSTHRKHRLSVK